MTVRPIIFSVGMARALWEGRKTQTRRVLREQPVPGHRVARVLRRPDGEPAFHAFERRSPHDAYLGDIKVPYATGDLLWVRETWAGWCGLTYSTDRVVYRASSEHLKSPLAGWRPSIHMPRRASRMTLEVTAVRVERVQGISEADAKAEGVRWHDWPGCKKCSCDQEDCEWCSHHPAFHVPAFRHLWDSINGKRPGCAWDDNPWVVAVSFTHHRQSVDELLRQREAA